MIIFSDKGSDIASENNDKDHAQQLEENNDQSVHNDESEPANNEGEDASVSENNRSNNTEQDVSGNNDSEDDVNRNENAGEDNRVNYRTTPPIDGEWEPIGTVQEEPFIAVYDKNHVNWEEMTRALQYATGIGDDIVIWWLGNGGDHLSAEGYVSDSVNKDTPYKVRLQWVTNRGWKPVSVEQLNENPYR